MHQFKITNRQVRKEIKQELKTIDVKLRNDPGVQKEVMVLKQNLATQLATMKQQFNAENKVAQEKHRLNLPQWRNELNQKLNTIITAVGEDNKILKTEYLRQKTAYHKLMQEGGKN